jgi:hypothetical protein
MLYVYDTFGDSLPLNSEESGTDGEIEKEEDDDGDKIEVVTFAFVVSGSALTSTTISNPIVVKTVKSQWASLLGVSSSSVYVRFVTDLSTGVTSGPFGPNDSINQGSRQRRLKKTFDTDNDESIKDNGSGPLGKQMQLDKTRFISSSRRILGWRSDLGCGSRQSFYLFSIYGTQSSIFVKPTFKRRNR